MEVINYLIAYIPMKAHKDPDFRHPAYGDSGLRGNTLKKNLSKGSYLFFHTTIGSQKYISGYLKLSEVKKGSDAIKDPNIRCDAQYDDWCFIGDPKESKKLRKPLPFNRELAKKLSLNIDFTSLDNENRTELQVIASATRSQRKLNGNDIKVILNEIDVLERNHKMENSDEVSKYIYFYDECQDAIPFDEVHQIKEHEIQLLLRKDPTIIGSSLKVIDYEKVMPDGDRLDLLLEDNTDNSLIVAELKAPNKTVDTLPTQVASYARDIEKEFPGRNVRKMIICDGKVSPRLRKACENLDIELIAYGLKLACFPLK